MGILGSALTLEAPSDSHERPPFELKFKLHSKAIADNASTIAVRPSETPRPRISYLAPPVRTSTGTYKIVADSTSTRALRVSQQSYTNGGESESMLLSCLESLLEET